MAFSGEAAVAYAAVFEALHVSWNEHVKLIKQYPNSGDALSILDIGSGPGEPSCTLAAAFPNAKVTCTDVAPDMNEKAKARAEKKGVALSYGVCSGDDLSQFADDSFDYVVMNLALMFIPDRLKGLRECFRVLKPGGKVLSTCWKTMSYMAAIGKAMSTFTGTVAPPPPINPMALKADNAQEDLAKEAGLELVHAAIFQSDTSIESGKVVRAVSLIPVGPKLKEMEAAGQEGATAKFQDVFMQTIPDVAGIVIKGESYTFEGQQQIVVMGKAA